jgi:hypothetical protein
MLYVATERRRFQDFITMLPQARSTPDFAIFPTHFTAIPTPGIIPRATMVFLMFLSSSDIFAQSIQRS